MIKLEPGRTYTARVTVRNTSTVNGQLYPATMVVRIESHLTDLFFPIAEESIDFAAGETKTFQYSLPIPAGTMGLGNVWARVFTPTSRQLIAQATVDITTTTTNVSIIVVVTDSVTRFPIPGAKLTLSHLPENLTGFTDGNGRYTFANIGLDVESPVLNVSAIGYTTFGSGGSGGLIQNWGDNTVNISLTPLVRSSEPSALLLGYQSTLVDAIRIATSSSPNRWVMTPSGLQWASQAIPIMKTFMVDQALVEGLIFEASEASFRDAVMYYPDGTTIVPYWWPCPYDNQSFRSPDLLQAHLNSAHYEAINSRASIYAVRADRDLRYAWFEYKGVWVTWKNDSPFPIRVRVVVEREDWRGVGYNPIIIQESIGGAGEYTGTYSPISFAEQTYFRIRLELVTTGVLLANWESWIGENNE